jgi:sec-independent protein translocase protein TatC
MTVETSNPSPTLLRFLLEFRKRLIASLLVIFTLFFALAYFSNTLYQWLALPLIKHLPEGAHLIATQVIAPIWIPIKFSMVVAVLLSMPYLIYQLWAFVAPALYIKERRLVWPLLSISTALFYFGMAFAYFVIFPLLFGFLAKSAPQHVMVAPDISEYLDFTLKMLFVFGAIFEVPMITVLLVLTGVATRVQLTKLRPYAIVTAFIVGMLLAPPDVFSQTLLAIPLWLLFEIGLICSRFVTPRLKIETDAL